MNWLSKDYIFRLSKAENNLLQVLINNFMLKSYKSYAHLYITLNSDMPTIRRRESKYHLKNAIPNFNVKSMDLQNKLDQLLIGNIHDDFAFNDKDFIFRYSNGGTLPILRICNIEYYCLFFRDVFPVGWNIANGASDSISELVNPDITIKRELREELIIIDLQKEIDYIFKWDTRKVLNLPEYNLVRNLWSEYFIDKNIQSFSGKDINVKWLSGPDFLTINFEKNKSFTYSGCFLNINALDFGIEVDKIAKINLNDNIMILDGEIYDNKLLNRPIGLFEVNRLNDMIKNNNKEFRPDFLFYSGRRYKNKEMDDLILNDYLPRLLEDEIRQIKMIQEFKNVDDRYNLCPITERIIKRFILMSTGIKSSTDRLYDVFISYSSKDEDFAHKIYTDLTNNDVKCWFAPEDLEIGAHIRPNIDEVISLCKYILVILSPDSTSSQWVEQEIETALSLERENERHLILPIQINHDIRNIKKGWVGFLNHTRNIGDFSNWHENEKYAQSLRKLLHVIKGTNQNTNRHG